MQIDLVLHVGLSKTATTTIQNRLMKGADHYLGRDDTGEGEYVAEIKDLARRSAFLPSGEISQRTRQWVETVVERAQRMNSGPVAALSCEQLLNWRIYDNDFRKTGLAVSPRKLPWRQAHRTGKWPLASFLADQLVPAWSGHGRVRLVLALRRQSDWLASQYAQMSSRFYAPSQDDFENQVRELVARNDPYLFWDRLVHDLSAAVGPGNLMVFLFEELSLQETWTQLAVSMGLSPNDPRIETARQGRSNQRSDSQGERWNIRPSRLKMVEQFVEISWPESRLPQLRSVAHWTAGIVDTIVSKGLAGQRNGGPASTIVLTDELSSLVRAYCSSSNRELSRYLGRDLQDLGY